MSLNRWVDAVKILFSDVTQNYNNRTCKSFDVKQWNGK